MTARSSIRKRIPKMVAATGSKTASQNAIFIRPWALLILMLIFGQLIFFLWKGDNWAMEGIIAGTGVSAWIGWNVASRGERPLLSKLYSLVTVLAAGGWLALATQTGVLDPFPVSPTFDLWVIIGAVVCLAWNQRQGARLTDAQLAAVKEDEETEWDRIGLHGVRDTIKQVNKFLAKGDILIPRGVTIADVQGKVSQIESMKDYPDKSLTLQSKGGHSRRLAAVAKLSDPIAEPTPWPGLPPGKKTLFDPIPIAISEMGTTIGEVVARKSGTIHALSQGMNGSGKGQGEIPTILNVTNRGGQYWIIDTKKGLQTYARIATILDWLVIEQATARALLTRVVDSLVPSRVEHLSSEGLTEWTEASELSFITLQVEEAWAFADASELAEIGLLTRSCGIRLVISLQRADWSNINTTLREQLGTRKCYGLGGDWGTCVLDPDIIAAGADPTRWKNNHPGKLYLDADGMTMAEKLMELRTFDDAPGLGSFEAVAREIIAPRMKPLDPVSSSAMGELYARRKKPIQLIEDVHARRAKKTAPPTPTRAPTATVPPEATPAEDDTDMSDDDVKTHSYSADGSTLTLGSGEFAEDFEFDTPDPDPEYVPTVEEIGDRPDDRPQVTFGPTHKDSKPEYEAKMVKRLLELAEDTEMIRIIDFVGVCNESGYSKGTVYRTLDEWVEKGYVARVEHGWLPIREMLEGLRAS